MTGWANINPETPLTTANATRLVPINRPHKYRYAGLAPKAALTPAVDNTPGPGVMSRKNTAATKVSIGLEFCFSGA